MVSSNVLTISLVICSVAFFNLAACCGSNEILEDMRVLPGRFRTFEAKPVHSIECTKYCVMNINCYDQGEDCLEIRRKAQLCNCDNKSNDVLHPLFGIFESIRNIMNNRPILIQ